MKLIMVLVTALVTSSAFAQEDGANKEKTKEIVDLKSYKTIKKFESDSAVLNDQNATRIEGHFSEDTADPVVFSITDSMKKMLEPGLRVVGIGNGLEIPVIIKEHIATINFEHRLKGKESLYFQLNNKNNNEYFNVVIVESPTKPEKKKTEVSDLPLMTIKTDSKIPKNPCSSCVPIGNQITYDFSQNTLKNGKTPASTQRNFCEYWLKKRWFQLPNVNEEMTFVVKNVNPFKYDITMTDIPTVVNTELTGILEKAFFGNPADILSAIGDNEDEKEEVDPGKMRFAQAMGQLETQLRSVILTFQNAGDCFNACDQIQPVVNQITDYFHQNFKDYDGLVPLDRYLSATISKFFSEKADTDARTKLEDIVKLFDAFQTVGSGDYAYRVPQIKNVDQYIFTLNIIPKSGVTAGAIVKNKEIAVDILGGFKVDVSTGLFITALSDQTFVLRGDSSVLPTSSGLADSIVYNRRSQVITETGKNRDFGVSSFLHFYYKLTPSLNLAASLGAGLSINDKPKVRYLAGGSLLIGKTNRLVFTYGLAMGYVNVLSDRYKSQMDASGNIYTNAADTKIDTKTLFKYNPFVSITFSIPLTKKKEETAKSDASSDDTTPDKTSDESTDDDKAANDDSKKKKS